MPLPLVVAGENVSQVTPVALAVYKIVEEGVYFKHRYIVALCMNTRKITSTLHVFAGVARVRSPRGIEVYSPIPFQSFV